MDRSGRVACTAAVPSASAGRYAAAQALMRVLDLFSGIGGFSLGLERAGMQTVAFCEQNKYCHAVLKKHWPEVPIYDDVRTLTAARLADDGIAVDVICGGFPCQDISIAGKGAGLAGARSGLWWEFHRLIAEIRPSWVIIENVSALRHKGLGDVLRSLAAVGYDAEWHCIPASAIGAPHRRDRIWIVAYPNGEQQQSMLSGCGAERSAAPAPAGAMDFDVAGSGRDRAWSQDVADTDSGLATDGRQRQIAAREGDGGRDDGRRGDSDAWEVALRGAGQSQKDVAYTGCVTAQIQTNGRFSAIPLPQRHTWWETEPDVGRVVDGVPARLDRLKALGNAVVPQIPELIGRAIYEQSFDDK
jgi:DNA (cytosine-5)-methyltransferase 1